jgi:hypothetical protein
MTLLYRVAAAIMNTVVRLTTGDRCERSYPLDDIGDIIRGWTHRYRFATTFYFTKESFNSSTVIIKWVSTSIIKRYQYMSYIHSKLYQGHFTMTTSQ